MKSWLGLGDFALIFKVKTELNRSNLSMCCRGTSIFTENKTGFISTHISLASFVGHRQTVQNQLRRRRMPHSAASDQCLHCLLTKCSIKM